MNLPVVNDVYFAKSCGAGTIQNTDSESANSFQSNAYVLDFIRLYSLKRPFLFDNNHSFAHNHVVLSILI